MENDPEKSRLSVLPVPEFEVVDPVLGVWVGDTKRAGVSVGRLVGVGVLETNGAGVLVGYGVGERYAYGVVVENR